VPDQLGFSHGAVRAEHAPYIYGTSERVPKLRLPTSSMSLPPALLQTLSTAITGPLIAATYFSNFLVAICYLTLSGKS
jgi:hypothetical protein